MHLQVGHGHRIEHPLPHVERLIVVDPDHLPEHRAVLRPCAQPGERALRGGRATVAQIVVAHARHVRGITVQRRGGIVILLVQCRVDHRTGLVGVVAQGADVGVSDRWGRAGGRPAPGRPRHRGRRPAHAGHRRIGQADPGKRRQDAVADPGARRRQYLAERHAAP
ncbi:hypothetical protein G6F57_018425 [Rhizopus arrhizus]|nr:hypothetical protein G6F57_018425 [Rhizopus arrhizus]